MNLAGFLLAEGDGVHWFLNLCASVKIRLPCAMRSLFHRGVQNFVFVSNFQFRIFELPSVSHRIGRTYLGPQQEVEGLYQTKKNMNMFM